MTSDGLPSKYGLYKEDLLAYPSSSLAAIVYLSSCSGRAYKTGLLKTAKRDNNC